jgi:hypothetical protein
METPPERPLRARYWQLVTEPEARHELWYGGELSVEAALSRFVAEAPLDERREYLAAALDVIRTGTAPQRRNMRLVAYEEADGAVEALAPLVETMDERLAELSGAPNVALSLAMAHPGSPRLAAALEKLVAQGVRSERLTEAIARACPSLLLSHTAQLDWPADVSSACRPCGAPEPRRRAREVWRGRPAGRVCRSVTKAPLVNRFGTIDRSSARWPSGAGLSK